MSVHKDKKTNTWRVLYRYTDYTGKTKQTSKRGFATKREALAWERENANKLETKLDMTFGSFVEIYTEDMKNRVKETLGEPKNISSNPRFYPIFKRGKSEKSFRKISSHGRTQCLPVRTTTENLFPLLI